MKDQKLKLQTHEILQGDFSFKKLNLLLVFQVNCPGCFIYALPVANKLAEDFAQEELKLFGLSTAFEDFDLNTLENTRKLQKEGQLVGETLKILKQAGYDKWPSAFKFDLAFDKLLTRQEFDIETELKNYIGQLEGFEEQPQKEKDLIRLQVRDYFQAKKYKAYTFDENYLSGTPSWILFDREHNILFKHFGHVEYRDLRNILDELLPKIN